MTYEEADQARDAMRSMITALFAVIEGWGADVDGRLVIGSLSYTLAKAVAYLDTDIADRLEMARDIARTLRADVAYRIAKQIKDEDD